MQRNSVIQSARGRWLAGAAIIAGTMLVSACGSSHPAASTSSSASSGASATPSSSGVALAPSAAPITATAPTPATAPDSPAVMPAASIDPGGPNNASPTCAQMAAHNTGHVVAGATVEVFPTTSGQMRDVPIKASQLNTYLRTDSDTKIFLVGGKMSAITSLQEQFHP